MKKKLTMEKEIAAYTFETFFFVLLEALLKKASSSFLSEKSKEFFLKMLEVLGRFSVHSRGDETTGRAQVLLRR